MHGAFVICTGGGVVVVVVGGTVDVVLVVLGTVVVVVLGCVVVVVVAPGGDRTVNDRLPDGALAFPALSNPTTDSTCTPGASGVGRIV